MSNEEPTYEIHVHGQIFLAEEVTQESLTTALKPMWSYGKAKTFKEGAQSYFDQEAGIQHLVDQGVVQICWTVTGDDDFRMALEEAAQNMNELSATGASLDVDMFDLSFEMDFDDEDDEDENEHSSQDPGMPDCDADVMETRDDHFTLFIGPTPQAIAKVQRDLLVDNVVYVMEDNFEPEDLGGVIREIDALFEKRGKMLDSVMTMSWMKKSVADGVTKSNGHAKGDGFAPPGSGAHGRGAHSQRSTAQDKDRRPDSKPTGTADAA